MNTNNYDSSVLIPKTQPLIKWPGGKRSLVRQILGHFPKTWANYYEPFLGGAAVFFAAQPENAILSDANEELINAYVQVRDSPDELIRVLRTFKNSETHYYEIRDTSPRSPLRRAARLLYLTRLSFNGIHRVNLRGQFNVPYGKKTHLASIDENQLWKASEALKGTEILHADFEDATKNAAKNDVIYFDPPYTVAHATNGFVKYNENIFSWQDQQRLAIYAKKLAHRGCRVVISNADHPSVHELYSDFECEIIERPSVIAASSTHRRLVTECIFAMG